MIRDKRGEILSTLVARLARCTILPQLYLTSVTQTCIVLKALHKFDITEH